jgi:hypothetical protein
MIRNVASVAPGVCALGLGLALVACRPGDAAPAATPAAPLVAAPPNPALTPSDAGTEGEPLTVPGPAAAPCTSDAMCVNHRCNVAYGKCAFPCASDGDCVRGTFCFKAVISTCQSKPPNE